MLPDIAEFFVDKCIFITGGTGFIGKCLVVKLLSLTRGRVHLVLLLRPKQGQPVATRLQEFLDLPICDGLRDLHASLHPPGHPPASTPASPPAPSFAEWFAASVECVAGGVEQPGLGLAPDAAARLLPRVHLVLHCAATTAFDELLGVAVRSNTLGAGHAAAWAACCPRLLAHVHVSTAFVHGSRPGVGREEALPWGLSLAAEHLARTEGLAWQGKGEREGEGEGEGGEDGAALATGLSQSGAVQPEGGPGGLGLDVAGEIAAALGQSSWCLDSLLPPGARPTTWPSAGSRLAPGGEGSPGGGRADPPQRRTERGGGAGQGGGKEEERRRGMRRAQSHGWQDAYTFSKALGEMVVGRVAAQAGMRCAIVRPSIVESAVSEPLPGWLEGVKVAEPLILAYGLGKLAGFPMSRTSCLDVVPVDMVVNTLVGALWATATGEGTPTPPHLTTTACPDPRPHLPWASQLGKGGRLGTGGGEVVVRGSGGSPSPPASPAASPPLPTSCPGSPAQPLSTVSSVTRCSSSEEVEAAAGGAAGGPGPAGGAGGPQGMGGAGGPPLRVYQVATGAVNPLMNSRFPGPLQRALQQHPLRDRRSGLLLKVDAPFKLYADTASFMREVEGGLPPRWLARLTGQLGRLDQGLAKLRRMTGLYTPYTFNQCRFECSATEQLMAAVASAGGEGCGLGWGLRELDWEQYITQVHVPGVRRYVLKQKEL